MATLPKDLPVIGSVAATRVVERLGFTSVKALSPGESTNHQGLRVRASAGAPVPMVENGYCSSIRPDRSTWNPTVFSIQRWSRNRWMP